MGAAGFPLNRSRCQVSIKVWASTGAVTALRLGILGATCL